MTLDSVLCTVCTVCKPMGACVFNAETRREKKSIWLNRFLFLLFLNDYEQIRRIGGKKKAANDSELCSFFS